MSWIKEANKIGEYRSTHEGFRIYITIQPTCKTTVENREDGVYAVTRFTSGACKAIDKTGLQFEGKLEDVLWKIDKEILRRHLSKKYKEELEWK